MKKLVIIISFTVPFFASAQSIPHRADLHQSDDWASLQWNDNSSLDATTAWVTRYVTNTATWTGTTYNGNSAITYANRTIIDDHGDMLLLNQNLLGRDTTAGSSLYLLNPFYNGGTSVSLNSRFRTTPAHSGVEGFGNRTTIDTYDGTKWNSWLKLVDGKTGLGYMPNDPTTGVHINAMNGLRIQAPSAANGKVWTATDTLGNGAWATPATVVTNPNFENVATGQTSTNTYSYTVTNTGSKYVWVGCDLQINSGSGSAVYTIKWYDPSNVSHTYTQYGHTSGLATLSIPSGSSTLNENFPAIHFSCYSGSLITIAVTTTGTINYNWSVYGEEKGYVE